MAAQKHLDFVTRLFNLRKLMKKTSELSTNIAAYIIPHSDSHQSEITAERDERLAFISGFTGSQGSAIVTDTKAALWTDSRYFLQAAEQLNDSWILMKEGLKETPSQLEWLKQELGAGSSVGVDPSLVTEDAWQKLEKGLIQHQNRLVPLQQNLVDLIWLDRPLLSNERIFVLPIKYSGETWISKVSRVRSQVAKEECSVLLLSALDDIAWLLNLRGADVPYNPVFFAYCLIEKDNVSLYMEENRLDEKVRASLTTEDMHVTVHPYSEIRNALVHAHQNSNGKVWFGNHDSHYLTSSIPSDKRHVGVTPVARMKAIKNATELQGMRNAHIKDAVAKCEYLCWLEQCLLRNEHVTEISGADKLEALRREQQEFVSLSFCTISSVGEHGSVIHYRPTPASDKQITTSEVYLCDSGAQYMDGTTDVTRTMHFGNPTSEEKEVYTLVLKGHIRLARAIFPTYTNGSRIDVLAREALWRKGLNYLHGTGHGVGSFLNVHEGPCKISFRPDPFEMELEPGMVLSNEPGYYKDNQFGVRIENLVIVVPVETEFNFGGTGYCGFETITLIPIQSKMIDPNLLTADEISWLDDYHEKCRHIVGEEMKLQGKKDVYKWLVRETNPLS